jgi:hypothetical protein
MWFGIMVFSATFNNMSVISWRSVLLFVRVAHVCVSYMHYILFCYFKGNFIVVTISVFSSGNNIENDLWIGMRLKKANAIKKASTLFVLSYLYIDSQVLSYNQWFVVDNCSLYLFDNKICLQ